MILMIHSAENNSVVHGSDGPAGRVWSGRAGSDRVGPGLVGSRFCRILAGRVGSDQHFGFCSFSLINSWYLNRYYTFGLTEFYDIQYRRIY